jgi:hypothetical protein
MDRAALERFLHLAVPEGHLIDYKCALTEGSQNKQHHEFLKDVSAFANANGGHLLLGVREPSAGLRIEEQIVGIEGGDELAHNLERLCASGAIDPRIPGIRFHTILVGENRHVLIVQVPPSIGRPHMITYDKRTSFHIRHSESVQQMTAHDIRESVLRSASAENRAQHYLLTAASEVLEYFSREWPTLLLQTMPLIAPTTRIDTNSPRVVACLRSDQRVTTFGADFCLSSMPAPRPTLHGVLGTNSRTEARWITEVHRNGYSAVSYRLHEDFTPGRDLRTPRFYIWEQYRKLLEACCQFFDDVVTATEHDVPFVLKCRLLNAREVALRTDSGNSSAWNRTEINLPDGFRQTGESFAPFARDCFELLHNAFGVRLRQ